MIEQVDRRLLNWINGAVQVPTVSLALPPEGPTGSGISIYLLEILPALPARGVTRAPLQLALRYLVTAWADEPAEAHRLLGMLAFAAQEHSDLEMELELDPLPAATWDALHVIPQAHFLLRVLLRRERPEPETRLVREPLKIQAVPTAGLSGTVLGPGNVPLAGAVVELPSLGQSQRTNNQGSFHFAMLPSEPAVKRLRVRARRRVLEVTLESPPAEEAPLVINFPLD